MTPLTTFASSGGVDEQAEHATNTNEIDTIPRI
jgi:hypothetical protein